MIEKISNEYIFILIKNIKIYKTEDKKQNLSIEDKLKLGLEVKNEFIKNDL